MEILLDEDGNEQRAEASKGQVAATYFSKLFTPTRPDNFQELFQDFLSRVTEDMNQGLIAPVTREEVKEAIFSIKAYKAPGSDGITGMFFQQYWEIIGEQVTNEIQKFFTDGIFPNDWNYHNCV